MRFLLDTDHITIWERGKGPEYAALAGRIATVGPMDLAFSVISFHEQTLGAHSYINGARTPEAVVRGYAMLADVIRNFAEAPLLPFDSAAASSYADLTARRIRVATMDLRIASIALSRGLVLLTRNVRDFGKVPGLITKDWTA